MVNMFILNGLSVHGAGQLLIEEGYIEGECSQLDSKDYDAILVYPYTLYDDRMQVVDRVCHVEYCMLDNDDEFDAVKTKWARL